MYPVTIQQVRFKHTLENCEGLRSYHIHKYKKAIEAGRIRLREGTDMPREQFQSLTEPMYYILMSLQEECCGVDIMEKVKALSGGRVQVGPGTLYTLLAKFQEGDIIEETRQEGRKKWYRITEKGKDTLKKEYRRILAMARDGAAGLEGDKDAVLEMEGIWDSGYSGNGVFL